MPISKTGTLNRTAPATSGITALVGAVKTIKISNTGFTLLELIVVIMIMGMIASLVIPRISSFHAGEMKRTSRRLASLIQQLTQDSALTKEHYRLYFNLDSSEYWTVLVEESVRESDHVILLFEKPIGKPSHLPEGILFEDIMTAQKGMVTEGEVFSEFYPIGIESMTIHLKEGESHFTLVANPLTGRVKTFDHYLEETNPI
ncbi:MAG: prepilin-type N-terminal cleavage/methylation domain-containing protein [Nitrospirae bacterium]|nr:prepilin-type N-terminal cleavage/methylation domain-containing protein [Candidatus Troglogloeales bacterium]